MRREKEIKKRGEKTKYEKPVLTKHKRLKDITAGLRTGETILKPVLKKTF